MTITTSIEKDIEYLTYEINKITESFANREKKIM